MFWQFRKFTTHLPLRALVLYRNNLVISVLSLSAELAHTLLLIPAEHLQQPLVLLTHPVLQVLHRLHELVQLQGDHPLVRLQVGFTVRCQTHQAGFQCFHLQGRGGTDITHHLTRLGWRQRRGRWADYHLFECVCELFESYIYAYFRPWRERPVTRGALADVSAFPLALNAGLAEVVSAGSRHWVCEHLLTDGTVELFFW